MKREDDEQLWDLLGRASKAEVSPFFARNVLRQIRQKQSEAGRWFSWRRLVPASAVAVAMVATFLFVRHPSPQEQTSPESQVDPVIAQIDTQDYEVVADLDNLLDSDDNSPWDDNSSL